MLRQWKSFPTSRYRAKPQFFEVMANTITVEKLAGKRQTLRHVRKGIIKALPPSPCHRRLHCNSALLKAEYTVVMKYTL
ncbi:hypothetical protein EpCFBP13511_08835 [Erwinia persicina]|uniref:Uncharacterized protein n=1 Tax=Erwinia persicina TaxID=55211 RepID=A0A4U3FD45_9GAMM|nr:hypothetical protein EpCFBP13511_08835 [Erwinia persicina]